MDRKSLIVVALGGNAISLPSQVGNVDEQFANSRLTAKSLVDLVESGHQLAITHGNGPQIGNFLLRNQAAADVIYPLPMEVAVAHVQGGMGYMIAQTMMNELDHRGQERRVTSFVTTILVDEDDPAFENPTKPIGRRLDAAEASRLESDEGWKCKEISPGVFRRVVPSPVPQQIMELQSIQRAIDAGELVVACGGGGIPVVRDPNYGLHGVRAVIDKDLASALLARKIGADTLMILTNVDRVFINFGKPDQTPVESMTVDKAQGWLDEGQFPSGSMGPKIQGAIEFLRASSNAHAKAMICSLESASDAMAGRTGTLITKP